MTTYLFPCPCSARIEIGAGQAGGQVTCPACGARLDVPKLRDFRDLEVADTPRSAAAGRWNWRHASMLAAAAVALVCGAVAAVVGVPPRSPVDAEMIRAAVMAADDASIIAAWKSLAASGVDRQPTPDELAIQRISRFRRGAAIGLTLAAAIGAAAAIAAGLAILFERKPSP